jgi:hypothetical protein
MSPEYVERESSIHTSAMNVRTTMHCVIVIFVIIICDHPFDADGNIFVILNRNPAHGARKRTINS